MINYYDPYPPRVKLDIILSIINKEGVIVK